MGLFQEAISQQAYLKMGLFGFQGSGKSFTAARVSIGLHHYIQSTKPVGWLDTETGSDFLIPQFHKAGIKLFVSRTRSFADLCEAIDEAEKSMDILLIDSITHFWRELVRGYKTKKRLPFLRIQDWGPLKDEWQKFSDRYVNSRLHLIMCGRAANVFQDVEDDTDDDKKSTWKAVKVGTKMNAEGETGYEPSLLVEMAKVYLEDGGKYLRRANVIKERFGIIDSKEFDFSPDDAEDHAFTCFLPHISLLNLGGEHKGIDTTRTSEDIWGTNGSASAVRRREVDITLGELKGLYDSYLPGAGAKERKIKADIAFVVFGKRSWEALEAMKLEDLKAGVPVAEHLLKQLEDMPGDVKALVPWLQSLREAFVAVPDVSSDEEDVPDFPAQAVVDETIPVMATASESARVKQYAVDHGLIARWNQATDGHDEIAVKRLQEIEAGLKDLAEDETVSERIGE